LLVEEGERRCLAVWALTAARGIPVRSATARRGRELVTLEDAGRYLTKLPKPEHEAAEWQAAMEALILVATSGGPTMFARIGVMRALNRHVERVLMLSIGAPSARACRPRTSLHGNWSPSRVGRNRGF
jgi:hypothetical protein